MQNKNFLPIKNVVLIGEFLPPEDNYSKYEKQLCSNIATQISNKFTNEENLLINMTWFGAQFGFNSWHDLLEFESSGKMFDNVFFLAKVDPPYLSPVELQEVKNKVKALRSFFLGNFDGIHQFNFFAPILAKNFKQYNDQDLLLNQIHHLFINYNRKPKPHRVEFVKKLVEHNLVNNGIITLGQDDSNNLYFSIGESQCDYVGTTHDNFGIPMDYYTLHRIDLWKQSFLYINAATEFNPINDLFCQQDTFKPMLGLRPFVINGVQKTYRWLRLNGFKTFNHYWPHIDIENGDVHDTIIELIKFLKTQSHKDLLLMYNDMLPALWHNKFRFFEFAKEQTNKMNNIFSN